MKTPLPSVSVLIACYNAESYIGQALESLLNQSHRPDEIIVVDDGSTDASIAKISHYLSDGVLLIQQINQGASAARNRAFAASSGTYVIFVDADDLVGPRHLESLLERARGSARHVVLSKWDRFYRHPEEARFPDRPTERDMSGVDWLMLDWENAKPMTQSGMILIPRTLIEEYGGWDEDLSLIDDFEFFARTISRSDGVLFAPNARLYYRSGRKGSLSSLKERLAIESSFRSISLGTQHLLAVENSARTRQVCANVFQDFDFTYYPRHRDLRARARARVRALGGADLEPDGPPGFHKLRRFTGWRAARLIQILAEKVGLNRAARRLVYR
jgi:glycosyltransferase involved in cell wall biosynthesis